MTNELIAQLCAQTPPIDLKAPVSIETPRGHAINRQMQEKSGRLYCDEDYDCYIPPLELYAAR
jgi:hypothetical protein